MDELLEEKAQMQRVESVPLSEFVVHTLENYFKYLEGEAPTGLYDMVIKETEKGLFRVIMQKAKGNQTLASQMCGLARGTLRKKLKEHNL